MTLRPESLGGCLTLPNRQEPSKKWYQMEAPTGRGSVIKRAR